MTDAIKTVANDMAARRIFATPELAADYLTACATTLAGFTTTPFAAPGVDLEGNFDPAIYSTDTEVMVATLKNAANTAKGKAATVKAIVVVPVPTLDALLVREDGRAWIQKIIHKELNHVAVRALREAEDISTVVDQIPTTIDGFIATGREGGAGILEAFNELYKPINAVMSAKVPVWKKARLIKSELRKCMESRGYALEFFSALEDRGEGKESLIVKAIQIGIGGAQKKGLDPTIFERWLATRNAKTFTADDSDDVDFDLDTLTDDWMDSDESAGTAADAVTA